MKIVFFCLILTIINLFLKDSIFLEKSGELKRSDIKYVRQ
jgi:hypothetical protein